MRNKLIGLIVLVILLGVVLYFMRPSLSSSQKAEAPASTAAVTSSAPVTPAPFDPKNATYTIDDTKVTLVNGTADTSVDMPDSASDTTTQYFGNSASGDLNGDKIPDQAFLVTQYGAGTGVFYYAVAVIRTKNDASTTNAVFIGDRISPQTTQIKNGEILVNYADRKAGAAMTETPSVAKTMHLKVDAHGTLSEI